MWISTLPVSQAKYEKHSWLFSFPDNSYQITNSAGLTFQKVKIKNPSNLLPANATTAEKVILYILCLLNYFISHLNCHSFSNLTFSQPSLLYTNLFKSYSDQTIVLHRIFQCFLISLRPKSRVLTLWLAKLHLIYNPTFLHIFDFISHYFFLQSVTRLQVQKSVYCSSNLRCILLSEGSEKLLFPLRRMIFLQIFLWMIP